MYPFYKSLYLLHYLVNTNLANVRCTHNHWLMCCPNFTRNKQCVPAKTQAFLHVCFVQHISISGVSITHHRFFQKPSQLNKIVLKQVKTKQ